MRGIAGLFDMEVDGHPGIPDQVRDDTFNMRPIQTGPVSGTRVGAPNVDWTRTPILRPDECVTRL